MSDHGTIADRRRPTRESPVTLDGYLREETDSVSYEPARCTSSCAQKPDEGAGLGDWDQVTSLVRWLEGMGSGVDLLGSLDDAVSGVGRFQVVPNVKIYDPASPDKPMLVTVILPHGWRSGQTARYPILLTANGYTRSNNFRILRDGSLEKPGASDVWNVLVKASGGGRTGAITLISNAGGESATGLQPSALANVGRAIDLASMYGGDRHRVIAWGGSRGGLTALVWGANPNQLDYTVRGIFARVPFPEIGTVCASPLSALPSLPWIYDQSFGGDGNGWDYALHPEVGSLSSSDLCARIVGASSTTAANARSGAGQVARLSQLATSGTLHTLVMSYGSQDSFQPLGQGLTFHRAVTAAGVPTTTYVGLGGGHAGIGNGQLETDVMNFLADLASNLGRPRVPPPGLVYFTESTPGLGGFAPLAPQPTRTLFSVRLPSCELEGRGVAIEVVGPVGGEYQIDLLTKPSSPLEAPALVKSTGLQRITVATTEVRSHTFTMPPSSGASEGLYQFQVRVRASYASDFTLLDRTPLKSAGAFYPLELRALPAQPETNVGYYRDVSFEKRSTAFGVDEVP